MAAAGRSPFDLLVGEGYGDIPTWVSPAPVAATAEQIDEVALVLAAADSPLIIVEHGGRTDQDRDALVRIAEALSAPVFVFEFVMPAYHNFPRTHPLYGAGPVEPVLGEADAILLAGCDAPWHTPLPALRAGCAVIHADEDPMCPAPPTGLPHHARGAGKPRAQSRGVGHQSRNPVDRPARSRRALGPLLQCVRAAGIEGARQKSMAATDFVPAADLFCELHDTLPDDAICVDEIVAQMPQMIQFLTSIDGTRDDRPMPRWSKRITRLIRSAHRSTSAGRRSGFGRWPCSSPRPGRRREVRAGNGSSASSGRCRAGQVLPRWAP